MGEEIQYSHFRQTDYARYGRHLAEETRLLEDWFHQHHFSNRPPVAGYELEAWLIDATAQPCPYNERFLELADNPLLSPELARFNIELNVPPQHLGGSVLTDFSNSLARLWQQCQQQAGELECDIIGIGILPSLRDEHLTLENISMLERYRALNEQVLHFRRGQSIALNIVGHQHLQSEHMDVMLEAAATSLQIHLQVPQDLAVRYYNAAIVLSAPMVAISTNAPFMFGKCVWEETRIPVFEQSVPTGGFDAASHGPVHRVGFGMGYARDSLFECFNENIEHYPVMLPVEYDSPIEQMRYVRLHNGTIWRWNRPLIGFDDNGTPHLRIEHRVCSSGPSMQDNIANIAFFYGLVHYYATIADAPENTLGFSQSRDNFYTAAQHGINAQVVWTEQQRTRLQKLVLDQLLVEAEAGLHKLGIDGKDIHHNLRIIEKRVHSGQTGSQWQQQFAKLHGNDMLKLTKQYLQNQRSNLPVHRWDFATDTLINHSC